MSKRFNLREFQQTVLDRLQARTAEGGSRVSTLGVQVGKNLFLIEMSDISEVMSPPPMTQVPLVKPWYCGVANVRGNLYSIVDLGLYQGGTATPLEGQSRVLLVGTKHAFNAGLVVSKVLGLRDVSEWKQEEVDGETQFQDGDGRKWRRLNMTDLLQQPEFLQIGA